MATLSVSVPDELKARMAQMEEVNWSAVARRAFEEKVDEIRRFKAIVAKSKLTQKDADEIAKRINAAASRRFRAL